MAKYREEYENGEYRCVLTFRGVEFDYTMKEHGLGTMSDKKCFSYQINERFPDMTEEILTEEIDVEMLDGLLAEDKFIILDLLEEYEDVYAERVTADE